MENFRKLEESGSVISAITWVGEQMPGGFFIYRADPSQEILFANKAVLHIYGCGDMEQFKALTGNSFRGMVHPDDYELIHKSIEEQIADSRNEHLDHVEYRIVRPDGSIRWVDDYGRFASFPGYGDVYYVFISDVTENRVAQEELIRRESVFSRLAEQNACAPDDSLAVFKANLTTGRLESARGLDLFDCDRPGADLDLMLRARYDSFLVPGDREKYDETFKSEKLLDRFYKGEEPASFVAYCRRGSGRQCFVRFSRAVAIDPASGDLISFATETVYNNEKASEVLNDKVLVRQYDMVTYIVDNNYSVVIGDASRISRGSIFPKQRSGVYTDYIREQVLPAAQRGAHDLAQLEHDLSPEAIEAHLEEEEPYTIDIICEIDGEVYNKRFTYYAVDRNIKFYLLLKSDVTDVLMRERRNNEMLALALSEAEHANAAKTAFLSNMSHEIRTPMNAVIGLNTLALRDDTLSDKTRELLTKLGASASHLLELINDILDMSRIESGRMTLSKDEFSFNLMLEQINTMILSQCRDKGLDYYCKIIGSVDEWYFGDDMKLKQVLINILSNAIKFTNAPGSVTLTVEKAGQYDGLTTLRFEITDTGIGMDEEFIPKIFDAFSQEYAGRTNMFGSTGLGMAITKSIIEMMNGDISVQSKKGEGSRVTVSVTLRDSKKTAGVSGELDLSHSAVLVVDDDPIDLGHAGAVMDEIGVHCELCSSGAQALHELDINRASKKTQYDFVLLDYKMPEMNGVEVARRIRELYKDGISIILLTAYSRDDIMQETSDLDVDGFLTKPVYTSDVIAILEKLSLRNAAAERQTQGRASLEGRHILLAEDMIINAEIIKQLLSLRGMSVDHAENGQLALEAFMNSEQGRYDAVLMDVRMPVMDGLETAAAIRALDRPDAKRIPIIALTANAFDEDVQKSIQAGMNAHLSKPVEPERLFGTMEELIYEAESKE